MTIGRGILVIVFFLVALILFVLATIPVGNGRILPAGLAFTAAGLLAALGGT